MITNPTGPDSGSYRVRRGGSWVSAAGGCRSAYRGGFGPLLRSNRLGFRLSRTGPFRDERLGDGSQPPEMVWIPGGEFTMGDEDSRYEDEKPAHQVRLDDFAIGKYPVTFAEYDHFCNATGRNLPHDQDWGRGRRPVINVSWDDATAYCAWLSDQTGEHYRLPTEAEWEYACRAGTDTRWSFGDDDSDLEDFAWSKNGKTHSVGHKHPNPWGLHDMHGNVWEWCQDWYGDYKR